ncbi:MAG: hypothetical protein ABJB03_05875 [Rhodoglobus sp.]
MSRAKAFIVIGLVLLLGIPAGGVAYAFWHAAGSGTGSGATGTIAALALSPSTPTAALYPGGQANVVLTLSNPNSTVVHVTSLTLNTAQGTGGFAVDAGHASCVVSTLSFAAQTNSGAGWNVPAKVGGTDGTLAATLVNALSMGLAAGNACQGATFTVYLAAS